MSTGDPTAPRHAETTEVHPRLLKCALVSEESRAFWGRAEPGGAPPEAQAAFEQYWFGAKSLPWVKELIRNLQARFGDFPEALGVLRGWPSMSPDTRSVICHWHVQLTDPLYRSFSGEFLIERRQAARPEIHRDTVIAWVAENGPSRWTLATQKQMASKLLSVALSAGLVEGRRDPRGLIFPRVEDEALTYLLHLLRDLSFAGTLLDNPYVRSVGLEGPILEARLRKLPSLAFQRTSDVVAFDWQHSSLSDWAEAEFHVHGLVS